MIESPFPRGRASLLVQRRSCREGGLGKGQGKVGGDKKGGQLVLWGKKDAIVSIQPVKQRQAKWVFSAGMGAPGTWFPFIS